MVEFLRKPESHGDKIALVDITRITKSINLLTFCAVLRYVVIERVSVHSPFIEMYQHMNLC